MSAALSSAHPAGANRDTFDDEREGPQRARVWLVLVVLLATVLCFVVSLAYAQHAGGELDRRAAAIATNAVPAIEHLSTARGALLDLQLAMDDATDGHEPARPVESRPFTIALETLERELAAYGAIPFFPHETERVRDARRAVAALRGDVELLVRRVDEEGAAGLTTSLQRDTSRSIRRADGAIEEIIRFNTEKQRQLATAIARKRAHAASVEYLLNALTLGLALLLAGLVLRGGSRYVALLRAEKRSAEQRAHDLASFSAKLEGVSSSSLAISETITRSNEPSTMFQAIADEARAIVHAAQCTLHVGDGEAAVAVRSRRDGAPAPRGPSLTLSVLHRGAPVGELELVRDAGERRFGPDDERLAGLFAASAGVAIENARLYREAQAATRAREDVLATVSHDLRNPLGALQITTQLLRGQVGSADPAAGLVARIERLNRRMAELVRDLLDAAQIEAGRLESRLTPEDLSSIAHEAAEVIGVAASDRSVRLAVEVEPATVLCERNLLLRVFGNLLGNALKFSSAGSTVTLAAAPRDGEVEVSVADTGSGIPPDVLEHVFDRYWQHQGSDRRGSGLGLYIAHGIVEAHGGHIWVESKLGEGTTFHFTLRRAPEPRAPEPHGSSS